MIRHVVVGTAFAARTYARDRILESSSTLHKQGGYMLTIAALSVAAYIGNLLKQRSFVERWGTAFVTFWVALTLLIIAAEFIDDFIWH